jgi:FKBP-type peptidyl-prolyl cis-trans isomerase FklB
MGRLRIAFGIALICGAASAQEVPTLESQKEKVSYALGMDLGNRLRRQSVEVDPDLLAQGLRDALAGGTTLLTADEVRASLMALQTELRTRQMETLRKLGEKNRLEGEAFLAENKTKEGVVALPSGLQYKVLKEGNGEKPALGDTVVCYYRGTLIDGTEFDSSYKRKKPAIFAVRSVVKGWAEALQLMPAGSRWQLFIPSDLAYGDRGAGKDVGPNATLIYEVELVSIRDRS